MAAPKRVYTSTGGGTSSAHESTNRGLFDFGMIVVGEADALGFCPICFNIMDMNGASNEHILTNKEFKAIFGDDMAEADYNADWNMMQAHARCNSSKGTRGIFTTWLAEKPTGLNPSQYEGLCAVLNHYRDHGKSSIGHFAKGKYKFILQYIVGVVTGRTPTAVRHFVET